MGCQKPALNVWPVRAGDEVWGCCVVLKAFALVHGEWMIFLLFLPTIPQTMWCAPDFGTVAVGVCDLCCFHTLPVSLLSWLLFPGLTSTTGAETLAQVLWGIPAAMSDLRQKQRWDCNVLNPMVRFAGAHQSELWRPPPPLRLSKTSLQYRQSQHLSHPQYNPLCRATSEEHLALSGNIMSAADSVVCVSWNCQTPVLYSWHLVN